MLFVTMCAVALSCLSCVPSYAMEQQIVREWVVVEHKDASSDQIHNWEAPQYATAAQVVNNITTILDERPVLHKQLDGLLANVEQTDQEMEQIRAISYGLCERVDTLQTLWKPFLVLMRRAEETCERYLENVCVSYGKNVDYVELDFNQVYPTLGLNSGEGLALTAAQVQTHIDQKMASAKTEQEKNVLRQIGFFLANEFTKEEFDIWLCNSQDVACLYIADKDQREKMNNCLVRYITELTSLGSVS